MRQQLARPAGATAPGAKFRVLVVDDHPLIRTGLTRLINRQPDLMCCGGAESIPAARKAITAQKPDLVLVDLCLGATDGLDLVKALRYEVPALLLLVISELNETEYAERALRAGAHGYVMKEAATDLILQAMRKVLAGEIYTSPEIAELAVRRMILGDKPPTRPADMRSLTERELQVLKFVAAGQTNRQIPAELNLSPKTVETYREHLKHKLDLHSASELLDFAKAWLRTSTVPELPRPS